MVVLKRLESILGCVSLVDVGCGPGGQVEMAGIHGIDCIGIDGDPSVAPDILHDFTEGPLPDNTFGDDGVNVAWCVEFVEHVEEKYMENYLQLFDQCDAIIMTHAIPKQRGHHHVNCKSPDYWIDVMRKRGFRVSSDLTNLVRQSSDMKHDYMRNTGLVFLHKRIDNQ